MNWTLIVVLVIIIAGIGIGAAKGIVKILFSCLSMILVIAVTAFFAPRLCTFVREHTKWDDAVRDRTEEYFEDKGILINSDDLINTDDLPFPVTVSEKIAEAANEHLQSGADVYNNYIVDAASGIIFSAIMYMAVFLLIAVILAVLGVVLKIVSRLPVLKQLNRLAGGFAGALLGLLLVWLLFIAVMVFGTHPFAEEVFANINSNAFLLFLYDKNIILLILLNLF